MHGPLGGLGMHGLMICKDLGPYQVSGNRRLLGITDMLRWIGAANAGTQVKSTAGGNSWILAIVVSVCGPVPVSRWEEAGDG